MTGTIWYGYNDGKYKMIIPIPMNSYIGSVVTLFEMWGIGLIQKKMQEHIDKKKAQK